MRPRLGETWPVPALLLALLLAPAAGQRLAAAAEPPGEPELASRPSLGVPSTMAALVFGGRDGGNLPAFAAALPLPADAGASPIPFVVEVDGSNLLTSQEEYLLLDFLVYALDDSRRLRGHFSQRLPLDLEQIETVAIAGGLRYTGHLELPPGSYLLRFLVLVPGTQRFALRSVHVEIPAPGARTSVPVALGFASEPGDWLPARQARPPDAARDLLDELPMPLPAALPVLAPGQRPELDLLFYGPPPPDQLLSLAILDPSGKRLGTTQLTATGEPVPLGRRLHRQAVSFEVPELAEGSYGLELEAASARDRSHPLQVAAFVVADPAETAAAWPSLLGGASVRRPTAGAGGSVLEGSSETVRAIAAAYREALSRYAVGSDEAALRDLAELEASTLDREGDEPRRDLERGQWGVVAALAERDPEALLPLVALHLRLDGLYRDERSFLLASHSQRMAMSLATEYARRVATPEARAIGSMALTLLATDLQEWQLWTAAQRLLAKAIEIDPDNRLAILSLAVGAEKRGLFREAVQHLERLVELDPKSAEGRLRLAINLRRVGERVRARQLLESVIGEANPRWSLALAYQELARMAFAEGRWEDALRLLEDGVARLPGQRRLRLLRAYALERSGRGQAAGEVIAALARMPVSTAPSPRYLYNRRAQGDRDEVRQTLLRNSTLRLAALADSLAEASPGGRG